MAGKELHHPLLAYRRSEDAEQAAVRRANDKPCEKEDKIERQAARTKKRVATISRVVAVVVSAVLFSWSTITIALRRNTLRAFLLKHSVSQRIDLDTPGTPQHAALNLLAAKKDQPMLWVGRGASAKAIVDRYILTVVLISRNEGQGYNSEYVESFGICDWPGVACSRSGKCSTMNNGNGKCRHMDDGDAVATGLILYALQAIPTEVGKLSSLTRLTMVDFLSQFPERIPWESVANHTDWLVPNHTGWYIVNKCSAPSCIASNNQVFWKIPTELGQLSNLKSLTTCYNEYLQWSIPTELEQLSSLTEMKLSCGNWGDTQSLGTIPTEVGRFTSLTSLVFEFHKGSIPTELGRLSSLSNLVLDHSNELTWAFPTQLGKLSSLTSLTTCFKVNPQQSANPTGLEQLSHLTKLRLSCGFMDTTIPTEVGHFTSLTSLIIDGLAGQVPTEIGRLSLLSNLVLAWNSVKGTIPTELGGLSSLRDLTIRGSQRTIPTELGLLSSLEALVIADNHELGGTIPTELGSLSSLSSLTITGNWQLTGAIPTELGLLSGLIALFIVDNPKLDGSIPTELGRLSGLSSNLTIFGTNLTGTIPTELGLLTDLIDLLIGNNEQLTGPIPTELGLLSKLNLLGLVPMFNGGTIPTELGRLSRLNFLGITGITGTIPSELGRLSELRVLALGHSSKLMGTIPTELGLLSGLVDLTLVENALSGTVPTVLAALPRLARLVLQHSNVTGDLTRFFCSRPIPWVNFESDCLSKVECSCSTRCY